MVEYWHNGEFHRHYGIPNDNWFDPPEDPDPIGECAWCEEDIYNEDHVIDGDIVCPACAAYWETNAIAVDFIKQYFGSMPELAEQCRHDDWMELFAEYMRECEPDMLKQVIKREETPHYQYDASPTSERGSTI